MSKKESISLFNRQTNNEIYAHMEYDEEFSCWVEGYKNSVNAQLQFINEHRRNNFYLDSAILPLMFSIHHFLELSLKSLYWDCQQTIAELTNKLPDINRSAKDGVASFHIHEQGHNLPSLLSSLKDKLKSIDIAWFENLEISQLEKFIKESNEITPNGFAWRYPHPETKKADEAKKKVFKEIRFSFHGLDYITIEKVWEKIQLELKEIGLLATNRPYDVNFTSRTSNGYWTDEELASIDISDKS